MRLLPPRFWEVSLRQRTIRRGSTDDNPLGMVGLTRGRVGDSFPSRSYAVISYTTIAAGGAAHNTFDAGGSTVGERKHTTPSDELPLTPSNLGGLRAGYRRPISSRNGAAPYRAREQAWQAATLACARLRKRAAKRPSMARAAKASSWGPGSESAARTACLRVVDGPPEGQALGPLRGAVAPSPVSTRRRGPAAHHWCRSSSQRPAGCRRRSPGSRASSPRS